MLYFWEGKRLMKSLATDFRLILSIVCAHILIYITYQNDNVFWYIYTATMLFCTSLAIAFNPSKNTMNTAPLKNILIGIVSGIGLYITFALFNMLVDITNIESLSKAIKSLYKTYSPSELWQLLVLFIIIIPGEEIFWRGYIQHKLSLKISSKWVIVISAILYSLPMLYAQNTALVLAGIVGGIVWAALYEWKKSLSLVIASHVVFDLLLLIVFPFY